MIDIQTGRNGFPSKSYKLVKPVQPRMSGPDCHPKTKGIVTEQIVIAYLIEHGYTVSITVGDNSPYDVIIEDGNKNLFKCQIKTGKLSCGCIRFNTSRNRINTKKSYRTSYDLSDVDLFIVFCYENRKVYAVPNESLKCECSLRIDPAKNSQLTGVRLAIDFEI